MLNAYKQLTQSSIFWERSTELRKNACLTPKYTCKPRLLPACCQVREQAQSRVAETMSWASSV